MCYNYLMQINKDNNLITISSFMAGSEQGLYLYENNKADDDEKIFKISGAYGPNSPLGMVVEELKKRLSKNISTYLQIGADEVSVEGFDVIYRDHLDLEYHDSDYYCVIPLINDETICLKEDRYEISALSASIWDTKDCSDVSVLLESENKFITASIKMPPHRNLGVAQSNG